MTTARLGKPPAGAPPLPPLALAPGLLLLFAATLRRGVAVEAEAVAGGTLVVGYVFNAVL